MIINITVVIMVGIIPLYYLLLLLLPLQRNSFVTGGASLREQHQSTMDTRTLSRMGVIFVFGCGYLLLSSISAAARLSTTTCEKCVSSSKTDDDKHEEHGGGGKLYPIQACFVKTNERIADEMAHQFAKVGKYHNYLDVKQIKYKFCLGHSVVLKVSTDDTEFFNKKHAVWPTRPEVDWIVNALRNQLIDVYFIHFESYAGPPPNDDGKHSYEEIPKILINLYNNNNGNRSTTTSE